VYGRREAGYKGGGKLEKSGGKLPNIAQYFAIEKNAKRWEPKNTGRTGSGRFKLPAPPPPPRAPYLVHRKQHNSD